jgi:hypothetical protein
MFGNKMKPTFMLLLFFVGIQLNVMASPSGTMERKEITGIVIDVRGLDFERTMCPTIEDENGRILTTLLPIDEKWLSENGGAEYYDGRTFSQVLLGKSRAGEKFLVVRAVAVKHLKQIPILSVPDTNEILNIPNITDIFKRANVVFLQ